MGGFFGGQTRGAGSVVTLVQNNPVYSNPDIINYTLTGGTLSATTGALLINIEGDATYAAPPVGAALKISLGGTTYSLSTVFTSISANPFFSSTIFIAAEEGWSTTVVDDGSTNQYQQDHALPFALAWGSNLNLLVFFDNVIPTAWNPSNVKVYTVG